MCHFQSTRDFSQAPFQAQKGGGLGDKGRESSCGFGDQVSADKGLLLSSGESFTGGATPANTGLCCQGSWAQPKVLGHLHGANILGILRN